MVQVWGRRSSFNLQKVMWIDSALEILQQHIPAGGKFGIVDSSSSGDEPFMARFL